VSEQHDLRALTRRWFEEVWNRGREEVIDEMLAPDTPAMGLTRGGRTLVGPAAFKEFYRPMRAAMPDIRVTVDDVIVEGDQSVCRVTARGTHTGDGLGAAPTGHPVVFTAIVWLRWRNGQVVQGWNEFDAAAVAAQMAPTAPTTAGDDLAGRPAVKPA
jgi:predicted ester cyclase